MNRDFIKQAIYLIKEGSHPFNLLGISFHVPIWSVDNNSNDYLVTCNHIVSEAVAWHRELILTNSRSQSVRCEVLITDPVSDLAILHSLSPLISSPLPCANDVQPGLVMMRGYPKGLQMEGSEAWGNSYGIETDGRDGSQVLDVSSEDIAHSWIVPFEKSKGATAQDIWRGISGGPVGLCLDSERMEFSYIVGIIKSLSPQGVGGRVYCVPITSLRRLCYDKKLFLEIVDPIPRKVELTKQWIGEILSGLDDPIREQEAWYHVSNLFFQGSPIIQILNDVLKDPFRYQIDISDEQFIRYFLARFAFKKGERNEAMRYLSQCREHAQEMGSVASRRILTLIEARNITESSIGSNWVARVNRLNDTRMRLAAINNAPDSYVYGEMASLIGLEVMKVFLFALELSSAASGTILEMVHAHQQIMIMDERTRPKQEVVNTVLEILCTLWGIEKSSDPAGQISLSIEKGFRQAKSRRNSIFYQQMMLSRAIELWLIENRNDSLALLTVIGQLLRRSNLTLHHEGIAQLILCLQNISGECAEVIQCSYNCYSQGWHNEMQDFLVTQQIDRNSAKVIVRKSLEWLEHIKGYNNIYDVESSIFERN